jgi:hypothetical protein
MPSLLEQQYAFSRSVSTAAHARYAVYRGNVRASCAKALAAAYPIVRKIVGEAFFDALAARFIDECPSRSGDLNRYGAEMAGFLERFGEVQDLPYLPDVARMEWCAHGVYFDADTPAFDGGRLAALAAHAERLVVELAPSCRLLRSAWPLARLWAVHQDDYAGPIEVDLQAGADRVLVYRPRWRAEVRSLARPDFAFLEACSRGARLGDALDAACAADPLFDPSTVLARWIGARVVAAVDVA